MPLRRRQQRVRIALPVKVYTRDSQNKPIMQVACTMDVTPMGARLNGVRCVSQPGEIISVERGKSKAYFRVMWIGEPGTANEAQVGLQCVEFDTSIWGVELVAGKDERYDAPQSAAQKAHS
jgi:hypothetical protein